MIIEKNKVVLINYSVKSTTGELIDSSTNDDPLSFIFGTGSLIKGLEKELDGKKQTMHFKQQYLQVKHMATKTQMQSKRYLYHSSKKKIKFKLVPCSKW